MNAEEKQTNTDDLTEENDLAEKAEAPLTKEEESFKDKYLRVRADLDNIQRRMREERAQQRVNSIINFTKELLPFIDNLDRAIAACKEDNEVLQGLKMSRAQLDQILSDNNIKPIPHDGVFDSQIHDAAVTVENTELPNNSIVEVLENGYVLGDRVIRYCKVRVTTGGPEARSLS